MATVMTQNGSTSCEDNKLYIRMRTRFDFSGNRTIGEFMMAKAINDGYKPFVKKDNKKNSIRRERRHPFLSAAALLLSCSLFLFCTIRFMGDVTESPEAEQNLNAQVGAVMIETVTDPNEVEIVFPQNQNINTTME